MTIHKALEAARELQDSMQNWMDFIMKKHGVKDYDDLTCDHLKRCYLALKALATLPPAPKAAVTEAINKDGGVK